MGRVGEAVGEVLALGVLAGDLVVEPLRDDRRAQRQIARRQPLGAGDDVGDDAVDLFGREEVAQAAEAGDHLVGDVDHVVFAADLERARVVAGRRHHDAARRQDRLGDEGAHLVGAELEDLVLEVGDLLVAEVLDRLAVGPPVGVGRRQVVDGVGDEVETALVGRLAAQRRGQVGRAVVGVPAADDVLLLRPALHVVVELHEAHRRIDGGRAAGGEEHLVEVARRQLGELGAQLCRRRRAQRAERRIVRHAPDLVGDGVGHLVAAVADVDAPHAARAVDELLAVGIVDVDVLGLGEDQRALLVLGLERVPRVDDVLAVLVPQVLGVVRKIAFHGLSPGLSCPALAPTYLAGPRSGKRWPPCARRMAPIPVRMSVEPMPGTSAMRRTMAACRTAADRGTRVIGSAAGDLDQISSEFLRDKDAVS